MYGKLAMNSNYKKDAADLLPVTSLYAKLFLYSLDN